MRYVHLIDELREKFPQTAKESKRRLSAAIALQCMECAGGIRRDVEACENTRCALHPHRLQSGDPQLR